MKQLIKCLKGYTKHTILTPVFVMLEVVMEVIIPILMARLIDYGIDEKQMGVIVKVGGLLLICSLWAMAFGTLAGWSASIASAGFARNLRKKQYYNIQNFSFSNIDRFSTASLITRLTTDVSNVQNAFQMIIRLAVRGPAIMIFSMIVCFQISVPLSFIFLAAIPILGAGLYFIMTGVHPIFERVFQTYDKLNSVVGENLSGIRVVKSFVREEFEIEKIKHTSKNIYEDFSKAEKTLAFNMPLMQLCMYACMLLVSWFGARLIVLSGGNPDTGLSTGELMSLIAYAMQILASLMMLSFVFVMIIISRNSAERIEEILDEESDLKSPDQPVSQVKDGEIIFENVGFRYSKTANKPCLDGINLHIKSGETIGILGGTGSSKSTLVQLIPRLYDPVEGSVRVGGVDTREYDLAALRDSVSMVLQKNVLFSGTIIENLRWGNESATFEEMQEAAKLAQADEFIQGFPDKYETILEQGGMNVSGGQKQRLCIARALLKKPKILILDDSTSAVDTRTDALIRQNLKELIPDTTKIIIAQRISSIQDADRIIIMDDGKVSAVGTHEELLSYHPIYREVYESQVRGREEHES